jgi:hypothetical protein
MLSHFNFLGDLVASVFDTGQTMEERKREIQDQNNTTWTCVQAFSGTNGGAAQKATTLTEKTSDTISVICTPSGGAQTVRLELEPGWNEKMSDQELNDAILSVSDKS